MPEYRQGAGHARDLARRFSRTYHREALTQEADLTGLGPVPVRSVVFSLVSAVSLSVPTAAGWALFRVGVAFDWTPEGIQPWTTR